MEKLFAVRNAIFNAYHITNPLDTQASQPAAAQSNPNEPQNTQSIAQGIQTLAEAVKNLPPSSEVASKLDDSYQEMNITDVLSRDTTDHSTIYATCNPPPSNILKAHIDPEIAASLDGNALHESHPSIPPPSDPEIRQAIAEMTHPRELCEYWSRWGKSLKSTWESAEKAGFDAQSKECIDRSISTMASVWWHAAQLKPDYLVHLTFSSMSKDSLRNQHHIEIARNILGQLSDDDLAIMKKAWRTYTRRLAKAAVGVQDWLEKAKLMVMPSEPVGLNASALNSLDMAEIAVKIAEAVQEEYAATMEFIGNQAPATTNMQKAYINYATLPYMPDVVALVFHILRLEGVRVSMVLGDDTGKEK